MPNLSTSKLALCALLAIGCKAAGEQAKDSPNGSPAAMPVPVPEKKEPTLLEKVLAEATLPGALAIIKPHLEDATGELDPGALTLALWSTKHLTWKELQALPETKHALVMKDPEMERGKRNCYRGSIVEIQVDRSAGDPVYLGGLIADGGAVIRFAAVGSTGELVQRSPARFCGVTTGLYSYSNSGGGTTHAVFLVGMFDLPENKGADAALKSASAHR